MLTNFLSFLSFSPSSCSSFDAKQLSFRLLFSPGGEYFRQHIIAVADTQPAIERPWGWCRGMSCLLTSPFFIMEKRTWKDMSLWRYNHLLTSSFPFTPSFICAGRIENLNEGLNQLDDVWEREEFGLAKIRALVQEAALAEAPSMDGTTEGDDKFKQAAHAFRQTFDLPHSERLVNCRSSFSIIYSNLEMDYRDEESI